MNNSLTEEIHFKFTINKEEYLKLKTLIDLIHPFNIDVNEGDTLKVSWTLWLHYLGECHKKMLALITLKDMGVLVESNIQEIKRGKILIEDFLKLMREIEIVELSKGEDKSL